MITGFRLALGGAQEFYGVVPDLTTFGKIVGGGMPLAVYGGRKDIMSCVAPVGSVYQAGTLSGNPIAVSAGIELKNKIYVAPSQFEAMFVSNAHDESIIEKTANIISDFKI